jgi:phosphoribosylaminoimidazole-succinocarboxamide synthase
MIPTFLLLEKAWNKFNVSLIDMKIEVGYTKDMELVIADVIDNDSWRIWPNGDPKKQLDKQSFRDGEDLSEVQKKYRIVTEYVEKFLLT